MSDVMEKNEDELVMEKYLLEGSLPFYVPLKPPEPSDLDDIASSGDSKWYVGYLHLVSIVMTIRVKVQHFMYKKWVYKITAIKGDNNGISATTYVDQGVACLCKLCTIYDIMKRRCLKTRDRSGVNLPILLESDEERTLEMSNKRVKVHVDTIREDMSKITRDIARKYRKMFKEVLILLERLVHSNELSNNQLRIWICTLKPSPRSKDKSGIEMFYDFCPHWFDTSCLQDLIKNKLAKRHLTEAFALKVEELSRKIENFEREVDQYFSNRVVLSGNNTNLTSLISLDPEWMYYPADRLYQLYKRACEALRNVRGYTSTVYFCSILKEYILLSQVQAFVKEIRQKSSKEALETSHDHSPPQRSRFEASAIEVEDSDILHGCSCSQLDLAAVGGERVPMPKIYQDFLNRFG